MNYKAQNLKTLSDAVTEAHKHIVVNEISGVTFKIAVNEKEYGWHHHPNSDELFIMFEGQLEIDFDDGQTITLSKDDTLLVPKGVIHRTRPQGRAVNLLIEAPDIETVFVDEG